MINKEVTESIFNELAEHNKQVVLLKLLTTLIKSAEFSDDPYQKGMIDIFNQISCKLKDNSQLLEELLACEYKNLDIGPIMKDLNINN